MNLMRTTLYKRYKGSLGLFLALALVCTLTPPPAMAAPGGIIQNGSNTGDPPGQVPANGFLFEPEVPLNSLKTVPIWNDLEQLLDNPYNVVPCSSLPATPPAGMDPVVWGLIRNTPGTTQITGSPTAPIYPAYCTTSAVVRRPGFGVTLPPLLVHPLNYNPTDGEEMRLLNPGYSGGRWVVPDELVQCSEASTLPVGTPVRTLCALRGFSPTDWLWSYKSVLITNGSRVLETEIDYNAPVRPDVANNTGALTAFTLAAVASNTTLGLLGATTALDQTCVTSLEVFPPEGDLMCGGDPGEPGYAGFGVLRAGTLRNTQYSTPAVPGVASPGTAIPASARLFDP